MAICVPSLSHLFLFFSGAMVSLWLKWTYCTVFSYYTHILTSALTLSIPPHAFHSYTPMTMFLCFPRWPWKQDKLNVLYSMYVTMLDWTLINLFKDQQIIFYYVSRLVYSTENNMKKGSSSSQWITLTEQTSAAINWLVAIPSILMSLFSLVSFKCNAVEMTWSCGWMLWKVIKSTF